MVIGRYSDLRRISRLLISIQMINRVINVGKHLHFFKICFFVIYG